MMIVRYVDGAGAVAVGVETAGLVRPLKGIDTVGQLLRLPVSGIRMACDESAEAAGVPTTDVRLLPPVDARTEVWGAGVTYRRSREARVEESDRSADVYEMAYDADRPELFFKSAAWRVTGHGETVSVRRDSEINVPEPELAVVLTAGGEIAGYTVCNDVSSRSIEGANPLYLPQAKVYLGGCAVGPGIRPAWEVPDPLQLGMEMDIFRDGQVIWAGTSSTSQLQRRLRDLAAYLFREEAFPDGVVLSTGTSLVPELPTTLLPGDRVTIRIQGVGTLQSQVRRGKTQMAWLAGAADDPARHAPATDDTEEGQRP